MQNVTVLVKSEPKNFTLKFEIPASNAVIYLINEVEKILSDRNVSFQTKKWGPELAAIWQRNYAEHCTISDVSTHVNNPSILNLILSQ